MLKISLSENATEVATEATEFFDSMEKSLSSLCSLSSQANETATLGTSSDDKSKTSITNESASVTGGG